MESFEGKCLLQNTSRRLDSGFKLVSLPPHPALPQRLTVRNPNAGKAVIGAFASITGGESSTYIEMAEKARERAFQRMLEHAAAAGGN
ncbi:hypothetical protein BGX34_000809, partial [Mortierella sp. NVP85]